MRLFATTLVLAATSSAFAQTGIDGVIGADWSGPGVITHTVAYDPGAPLGNFGSPGPTNHAGAYTTYMRGDGSYIYLAVASNPAGGGSAAGLTFMNVYLSTTGTGSNIGLEVGNNNFFTPGGPGGYNAVGQSSWALNTGTGVVEVAIPYSFFTSDPLGMGFTPASTMVQWRISQSLGYSAAGGASYGVDRLGVVTLPTPGAATLAGVGGLAALRRRRR
jgi:MYXO-CTERM domain-containing protein